MWSFAEINESRWFLASKIIIGYVVPLSIIIFCYSAIICKVRQSDTMHNGGHADRTQKTVIVVITVFFFTWLPNHAFNLGEIEFIYHSTLTTRTHQKSPYYPRPVKQK